MLNKYMRKLMPFPEKQMKYALLMCFIHMVSIIGVSLISTINILKFIPPETEEKLPVWLNDFFVYNTLITVLYFVFISFIIYLIMLVVTSRFVGPLTRITRQIEAYHQGDYSFRLTLRKEDEISDLSTQLNSLGELLEKQAGGKKN